MKIMKINTCKFEDNLFENALIIVNYTLNYKNENQYQIKTIINNDYIKYFFININIAHKMCETLNIIFVKLNKSREIKNYNEKKNKNIIYVIYFFMIIQNYIKSFILMMIIKLNQHSIILKKS